MLKRKAGATLRLAAMAFGGLYILEAGLGVATATPESPTPPQPTLSLDFDRGVDGVGTNGQAVPARVEGTAKFEDSKYGKAFVSGPETGYLHFPTQGILSPHYGTVEMWVCPLDWSGTEQRFHVFFDARGHGELYLYKYYQDGLKMLSGPEHEGPYATVQLGINNWLPGQWHYIAGTWSPNAQSLYVDGKLTGTCVPSLPSRLDSEFALGDNPWQEPGLSRTSSSLIARVRVYSQALSAEHIAAHFAGNYNLAVPISPASTSLNYTIDPTDKSMRVTVDNQADAAAGVTPQVDFAVTSTAALAPLAESAGHAFVDGLATASLQLGELKPGDYEVSATIAAGPTVLARLAKPLTIPSLQWEGNRLGSEQVVLPPWTALRVQRGAAPSVACWGRTYQFGASAFPVQINSRDRDMLARPIELNAVADSQILHWTNGHATVTSTSAVAAEIDGLARAQSAAGPVDLKTHFHIEYDGLMLVTLALNAPPALKIDSISLNIPLRSEVALLRHRWTRGWGGGSDAPAQGDGIIDSSTFIPYEWFGDNDRGLFWFCESGEQWPNFDNKTAIETVRGYHEVALRFNLLAHGQSLPANWRYQCGLQATPVKPLPANWRKWRLQPAPRANVSIIWPSPNKTNKYFGYPEAANADAFAKRVDTLHAQGVKAVPYSCLTYLSAASPEWKWFSDQWRRGTDSDASFSSDVAAYGALFETISPVPESWRDFIVWKNQQFMDRFGLDGYYHDNSSPYAVQRDRPGSGWRDAAGHLHQIYPILAYRDLYRRVYAMVKGRRPDSFLIAHMSGTLTIPILAYEDAYLDGENFRGKVQDSYLDVMSLEYFRAELMGRQWGLIPIFLTEFAGDNIKRPEPARGLMGLLMLHDVPVWAVPWSCNLKPVSDAYDALDAFGFVDAEFIPYFDAAPPASTALKDVYISVYKRADGRALAIVANLSRDERSGTVRLNAGRIGLPLDSVISWPDKGELKRDGDTIDLDIPGLGYRMLLIGKPPGRQF